MVASMNFLTKNLCVVFFLSMGFFYTVNAVECDVEHMFIKIVTTIRPFNEDDIDLSIPEKSQNMSHSNINELICERKENTGRSIGDSIFTNGTSFGDKVIHVYVIYAYRFIHKNKPGVWVIKLKGPLGGDIIVTSIEDAQADAERRYQEFIRKTCPQLKKDLEKQCKQHN